MFGVSSTRWPPSWSRAWFVTAYTFVCESRSHFSFETIITPHRFIHRTSYTFPEVAVKQNVLFPSDCWAGLRLPLLCSHPPSPIYRSETAPAPSGTGLTVTFSTGRDECGSAGAAPPWVFRAHPGGSDGNGGAGALLPTPVIIYRAWVSVGTGRWWILTRLMITLPMRVINIMKSYWACAVACDEWSVRVVVTHRWQRVRGG